VRSRGRGIEEIVWLKINQRLWVHVENKKSLQNFGWRTAWGETGVYGRISWGEPGSSVSIVTGCRLGDWGLVPDGSGGHFLYPLPYAPSRLWGPHSLLYSGYRGALSPGVKFGRGVMLTTHPLLAPRLRRREACPLSPQASFMACSGSTLLLLTNWGHVWQLHLSVWKKGPVSGVCGENYEAKGTTACFL
jgi:hypothetical protein